MSPSPVALARSTHPGPAIAVTIVSVVLAVAAGLEPWRIAIVGLTILANQLSVGLSNDWLDAERDRATGRTDKPVALGLVSVSAVRGWAIGTALASIALSLTLGWPAAIAQFIVLVSAWSYNLRLKNSWASVAPFIVSFGLLPAVATLAQSRPEFAPAWELGAGALLGVAAHFANVLPDLQDDAATGIRGLPHRLGRRVSGVVIALSLGGASALVVFGPGTPGILAWIGFSLSMVLTVLTAALTIARPPTRLLFQLIIASAIIDVVLLALS